MSVSLVINGVTYEYPETGDNEWGPDATDWAQAVTSGMLQKAGGLFQLLAEVDFGTNYGLKSLYYKSRTSNPASAGQVRLARADVVNWRNQANNADLSLAVDASDNLTFNGVPVVGTFTIDDTDSIDLDLTGSVLTANLNLSAAAAGAGFFKSTATIETDGLLVVNPIATGAQSGILSSADWTTFNGKQAAGNYITALTGDVVATGPGSVASVIQPGVITNSMVSSSAAIAFSKLASLTSANILIGSAGNVATANAITGDISLSNAGVTAYVGTVPLNKGGTGQTTKAPAFDALSPMTTLGDVIYGGASGTGTRLGIGSTGQRLGVSAGVPAWLSGNANLGVTSQTTTYAILTTDDVVLCSGSAFTATLPTAVGDQGKTYQIIKTDSILANIITVGTTSSQTIGAGGGTTFTLNTQGETLIVVSDNSNWQILEHRVPQVQVFSTTNTVTSSGGGVVKGTSAVTDTLIGIRQGNGLRVRGVLAWTTAGTAGSGDYLWNVMPSGATIDTGVTGTYTTIIGGSAVWGKITSQMVGGASVNISTTTGLANCYVYDTSKIRMMYVAGTATGVVSATGFSFNNSSVSYTFDTWLPVSGWNG